MYARYTRSLQLCPPIAATVCNEHTFSARLPRPCVNTIKTEAFSIYFSFFSTFKKTLRSLYYLHTAAAIGPKMYVRYTQSLQLGGTIAATVCNEHTFPARLPRPCVNNLNRSTNGFHSLLCVASPGWGNAVAASLQNVCRGKRKESKEKNGWEGLLRTTFQKCAPNIVINY